MGDEGLCLLGAGCTGMLEWGGQTTRETSLHAIFYCFEDVLVLKFLMLKYGNIAHLNTGYKGFVVLGFF